MWRLQIAFQNAHNSIAQLNGLLIVVAESNDRITIAWTVTNFISINFSLRRWWRQTLCFTSIHDWISKLNHDDFFSFRTGRGRRWHGQRWRRRQRRKSSTHRHQAREMVADDDPGRHSVLPRRHRHDRRWYHSGTRRGESSALNWTWWLNSAWESREITQLIIIIMNMRRKLMSQTEQNFNFYQTLKSFPFPIKSWRLLVSFYFNHLKI